MIRWTKLAVKQFEAIHQWISADSPDAAWRQCRLITNSVEQIDKFPQSGPTRSAPDERELAVPGTPYIVYYSVRGDAIFIRSIRHASRKIPVRFKR